MSPLKSHHITTGSIKRLPSQGELASERDRKTRPGSIACRKQGSYTINYPVAEILATFKSPTGLPQPVVEQGGCSFSCAVLKSGTGYTGCTVQLWYSAVLARQTRPTHLELAPCLFLIGAHIKIQQGHEQVTVLRGGNLC